jgi:hypothetical protein
MVLLLYWGFHEKTCTPKSSILIGFSIMNQSFWGTPIYGPPPAGWGPLSYKLVNITTSKYIYLSVSYTIEIIVICTNLAIPNWGPILYSYIYICMCVYSINTPLYPIHIPLTFHFITVDYSIRGSITDLRLFFCRGRCTDPPKLPGISPAPPGGRARQRGAPGAPRAGSP